MPGATGKEEYNEEEIAKEKSKSVQVTRTMSFLNHEQKQHPFLTFVRIMGWMKRFIFNCQQNKLKRKGGLSSLEVAEAEETVIKGIQLEAFGEGEKSHFSGIEVDERMDCYMLKPGLL